MLDERLRFACEMFPACETGADIGADHGKLALELVRNNKCALIQVTDISKASLDKAKRLFEEKNLTHRALFLCGDGFNALTMQAQSAAILGMGGKTICGIIEEECRFFQKGELILSPHTDLPLVRQRLYMSGYRIRDERVAFSTGRFYVLIRASRADNPDPVFLSEKMSVIGPCLEAKRKETNVHAYYQWQSTVLSARKDEKAALWLSWVNEML